MTNRTAPRATPVRSDDDLAPLRRLLAAARGRIASARRGVADELLIQIVDGDGHTWRIGTQASDWVLASVESVLPAASAGSDAVDEAVGALVGAQCRWLEVTRKLALVVVLEGERWLEVQADLGDAGATADDPPYWEVFTPDGQVAAAGPGALWTIGPATHEPYGPPPVEGSATSEALAEQDVGDLLRKWTELSSELLRRGVIQVKRSAALRADVAEELVRIHYGGFRATFDRAGWDVLTRDGERLEVKAATARAAGNANASIRPAPDVDALVVVLFSRDLSLLDAWYMPLDVVNRHLSPRANRDGVRTLKIRPQVLEETGVRRLDLAGGTAGTGRARARRR